jgi:RNA polymerase sigma-70 factor (ECF subfamily)
MDDDTELVETVARDLDGAFEALVMAHQDRLFSIALRMLGDAHDAEEAAQDALVRAYRAMASYPPERIRELRLRPWLATIVLNLCRTRIRDVPEPAARPSRSTPPNPEPWNRSPMSAPVPPRPPPGAMPVAPGRACC